MDETASLLDAYVAAGGNFIDTAHNYGNWVPNIPRSASERAIGAWMAERKNRDQLVLATKGGHPEFDAPEVGRLRRVDIFDDLTGSLEALQTTQIDLYWLHWDEVSRPVEEIIDTLNEAIDLGHVRYLGASNWTPSRIRAANAYAAAHGLAGFVADQVLWNAAPLQVFPYGNPGVGFVNQDRFALHVETGMAMIPFQAQAFGFFQRMHDGTLDQMNKGFRGFYEPIESEARFNRMREVMEETELTISQVVLGYLLSQPFVTIPIVGCQSVRQVADSMTALTVQLTPDQVHHINGGVKGSELPLA